MKSKSGQAVKLISDITTFCVKINLNTRMVCGADYCANFLKVRIEKEVFLMAQLGCQYTISDLERIKEELRVIYSRNRIFIRKIGEGVCSVGGFSFLNKEQSQVFKEFCLKGYSSYYSYFKATGIKVPGKPDQEYLNE